MKKYIVTIPKWQTSIVAENKKEAEEHAMFLYDQAQSEPYFNQPIIKEIN